jgi:hypothetical protein
MIDPKQFKVMHKDNADGTHSVIVGVLIKAEHKIPAKQVLEMTVGNKLEFFARTHERPLKAAVINHIYGDLAALVQQLKTLAKLTADKKQELEVYRVCTKIDKLLDMKI